MHTAGCLQAHPVDMRNLKISVTVFLNQKFITPRKSTAVSGKEV